MAKHTLDELIQKFEAKRDVIIDKDGKRHEKQHKKGKLFARERIEKLLDEGSFVETDLFVQHRCDNFGMQNVEIPGEGVVTGYGKIHGRLVYVFSQDFSVRGGALGEMNAQKVCKIMDLAAKNGAPVIGINESAGARIQEGVDSLHGYGQIFFRNTRYSGVVPQISIIAGPCAGGAVYSPAITDFIFMVNGISNMAITGPKVIKAVTGEDISMEDLGGAMVHNAITGNSHNVFNDEESCFQSIRELMTFLPQNNSELPPQISTNDDPNREDMFLRELVPVDPKKAYDVREVIQRVFDEGKFYEIHPHYAKNIVVGFSRLNGQTVGIVGNQPAYLSGALDINSSDKASRFIRFCDAFNIPLITFVDVTGFMPGKNQEYGGIIRHGAKLLYAYSEATVPKITVTLRKSYGGASVAMCSRDLGADFVLAWPQAEIAVMGASGAANVIFHKEIQAAENPEQRRQELIDEYEEQFNNPYVAAERGLVDMIIKPEKTRPVLVDILESLMNKREEAPAKKHGNIPL